MSHVFLQTGHNPKRPHCLAGHVRLELRNVVAKYPFERSLRFPGIQQNSDHRDYSPLSCGVGWTRIGIILHDCGGKRRATRRWRNLAQDWCAVLELLDALCSCKRQRVASATIISGPVVGSSSLHLVLWRLVQYLFCDLLLLAMPRARSLRLRTQAHARQLPQVRRRQTPVPALGRQLGESSM